VSLKVRDAECDIADLNIKGGLRTHAHGARYQPRGRDVGPTRACGRPVCESFPSHARAIRSCQSRSGQSISRVIRFTSIVAACVTVARCAAAIAERNYRGILGRVRSSIFAISPEICPIWNFVAGETRGEGRSDLPNAFCLRAERFPQGMGDPCPYTAMDFFLMKRSRDQHAILKRSSSPVLQSSS